MKIEMISIDELRPYDGNPRHIPTSAVDKVAESIREFGFRQPIVVDADGVVIVGHTRLLAAKKLGLEQVPVHVAEGLSEAQVKAYRIMDNRSGQEAAWDPDLLGVELADLKEMAVDLSLTGFDAGEIKKLVKVDLGSSKKQPKEPKAAPVTVRRVSCPHCGEEFTLEGNE